MKIVFCIILILIFKTDFLSSQLSHEWVRSYNGTMNSADEALSHSVDTAGNVYATGKILNVLSGFDIYTVKYNSTGNITWERFYNGTGNGKDIGNSIAVDIDGNVYVAGETKGIDSDMDIILIKYDSKGQFIWEKKYSDHSNSIDGAIAVVLDKAGNPVITGITWVTGFSFDIITMKYNSAGDILWYTTYNGSSNGNDFANDMTIDNEDNVFVTGFGLEQANINDIVTIKYNSSGEEQWVKKYNGPINGNDNFTSLTLDVMGNVLVTGSSVGSGTSLDFVILKYSTLGEELWIRRYTGPAPSSPDEPKDIACDEAGNIYITGSSVGASSSYDILTVKYSPDGDELWAERYNGLGGFSFEEARALTADKFGNVFVAGMSNGSTALDDIVIIKYDVSGNEVWVNRYNSPANKNDIPNNISFHNYDIIVSGITEGLNTGNDFAVLKYSQLTGINAPTENFPNSYKLYQNFPNPFNPSTVINYQIPEDQFVSIKVYDVSGKQIRILLNNFATAGSHEVKFDAGNLPGGIYFYKIETSDYFESKKMILIK